MRNAILISLLLFALPALAQQPQTNNAPLQDENVYYVQGVGPGYWPTAGSGLTLNLSAGTVNCSSTMTTYAGGTLSMTNSTTNYVYLDTSASCAPAVKTTAFITSDIPIAVVVASGGVITSITDERTIFNSNVIYNLIKTSGSPFTMAAVAGSYWNNSSGAYSFKLPVPVVGLLYCFGNYQAVAKAVSVIPSTGVTIYYKGVAGTSGSTTGIVSGGAAGDFICLEATDATTYIVLGAGAGTWTNN